MSVHMDPVVLHSIPCFKQGHKSNTHGAGETAQQLRAQVPEDPCQELTKAYTAALRDQTPSSELCKQCTHMWHTITHTHVFSVLMFLKNTQEIVNSSELPTHFSWPLSCHFYMRV